MRTESQDHEDIKHCENEVLPRNGPGRRPTGLEDYKYKYVDKFDRIMDEIEEADKAMKNANLRGQKENASDQLRLKTRLKNELAAFESRLRKKLEKQQPFPDRMALEKIR